MRQSSRNVHLGAVIPLFALLLGVLLLLGFFAVSIGVVANSRNQLMYAASLAARTALNEFHSTSGTTAQKARAAADRASPYFRQNARLLGYLGGQRRDPGPIGLSTDPKSQREAGTVRFGVWYYKGANCTGNSCIDVCNGNYPCFVESPMNAPATAINAAQVQVSLTADNSFAFILGGLFGRSAFTTTVTANSLIQPRCYEVLIDGSNSMVGDNYDIDIAKVVPSSVHPTWGGNYSSYSFSRSSREYGDFLYQRHIVNAGKSTANPPGSPNYPEPDDCSTSPATVPPSHPSSDWYQFSQQYQTTYGVPPSPAAQGEMGFIWCAMRTFRPVRSDPASREHFMSDYRPIVPNLENGQNEPYYVDAYGVDSGRGPEPLRTVLLAVHNLIKSAMNNGFGSDYMMIRTFGANLRPSIDGLYGRDDFPYLLQVTNLENGPIVRADGSEAPAIYPNFASIGAIPDDDRPYTNLFLALYQAIEDLSRDPIAGPPAPGTFACPANSVKRIIVASDFMANCLDHDDFGVTGNPANSCPYSGGGVPINYCFKRVPVGPGSTYCSNTFYGWKWIDLYKVDSAAHPVAANPYTGQPWGWSTRFFSGNPTFLSNALASAEISVLTIMAGNRVGANWLNVPNPNSGSQEYQWMDWSMWAARQNIDPQAPPNLNNLTQGSLAIVNGGAREQSDWNTMMSGLTGTPSDGAGYRPFNGPNRVAAWLALVSRGTYCPLRTADTRPGSCTPDDKLHPGNPNRYIHCDSVTQSCRSYSGATNCNMNPHLCTEYFDHQCMTPADRLQDCISGFTALPISLVERAG